MDRTAECVGAMTLASLLWLCCIATASAATGEIDVRFGANGSLDVNGSYDAGVLEQPDGKLLVLGRPAAGTERPLRARGSDVRCFS